MRRRSSRCRESPLTADNPSPPSCGTKVPDYRRRTRARSPTVGGSGSAPIGAPHLRIARAPNEHRVSELVSIDHLSVQRPLNRLTVRDVEDEKRSVRALQRSRERCCVEPTFGQVIDQRAIRRDGCEHSVRRADSRCEKVDDAACARKRAGVLAALRGPASRGPTAASALATSNAGHGAVSACS